MLTAEDAHIQILVTVQVHQLGRSAKDVSHVCFFVVVFIWVLRPVKIISLILSPVKGL